MTGKASHQLLPSDSEKKFADYFAICGLEHLEEYPSNGEETSPLCRSFKSKVLAHYPDNVAWNPFDDSAVSMLSLPGGLHFCTQKHSREPYFHSFIITREDNSRTYGHSLVFYEKVTEKKICSAFHTLQSIYLTQISSTKPKLGHTVAESNGSRSLPRSFKLKARQNAIAAKDSLYDINHDVLFCTKSLCLVTGFPFVTSAHSFLSSLHRHFLQSGGSSLEGFIYHILHQVPLPLPSQCLTFSCFNQQFFCQRPGPDELPLFDFSLRDFVGLLGLENILDLFTCALLENQILLLSSDYFNLMLVAESLVTLLFPFVWPHVYVPLLPSSLHHFLDAPVPYIMGLHTDSSYLNIPGQANLCLVHIDQQLVEVPEDTPHLPFRKELFAELTSISNMFGLGNNDKVAPTNRNHQHRQHHQRKFSWRADGVNTLHSSSSQLLKQSEALQQITAIAKRTGVITSLEDLEKPKRPTSVNIKNLEGLHSYLTMLKLNNILRETFLNFFINLFLHYENFVIFPSQTNLEHWLSSRDTVHNFDKTAFLSDQPEPHLPFLSRFLESQMFASFIDHKIIAQWEDSDPALKVFDTRIQNYGNKSSFYEPCGSSYKDSEIILEKRIWSADKLTAESPNYNATNRQGSQDKFPILDWNFLNQKYRRPVFLRSETPDIKNVAQAKKENSNKTKVLDVSSVAHCNWKFVDALLKECKMRTKRMLVEKMGQEAVELGHHEISLTGLEENTLIASLCDLLERVWSHGRNSKQGKSALWSHLISFMEVEECKAAGKTLNPNFVTPALAWFLLRKRLNNVTSLSLEDKEVRRLSENKAVGSTYLSLVNDVKSIHSMTEIKTDIGYARAWVRLAMEKKKLSTYLRHLLSNLELIRSLYKRYAFLRCDDEKEQFLYHLLTLNAVDYLCFTNTFTKTIMSYHVVIVASSKLSASTTTANAWIALAGTLGETGLVQLPRQKLELDFHHKNLGILTTLRIGHDNTGMSPKWMVEQVLVRNNITSHTYRFPCGRWLGKGVDDGSTERLLVGELLPRENQEVEVCDLSMTPPRCHSPSIPRRPAEQKLTVPEIQQLLGDAVNNIVKYFYKPEGKRGNLTILLCGEHGLVYCLEQVFLFGFKATRFFRHFYLWDFLMKVQLQFCSQPSSPPSEYLHVMQAFSQLVDKVNQVSLTFGKDGKFQLFVCLAIRDHWLHRLMVQLPVNPVTATMYEEYSFLREPSLITFVVQILGSLVDFPIELEASLTQGIE